MIPQNSLHGKKLLIAENNDLDFHFMERMLSHSGLKILRAHNSKEAISMSTKGFDLVLMNMSLHVFGRCNTSHQIKAISPLLPVIIHTKMEIDHANELYPHSGYDSCISVPINKEILLHEIEKHLVGKPVFA